MKLNDILMLKPKSLEIAAANSPFLRAQKDELPFLRKWKDEISQKILLEGNLLS